MRLARAPRHAPPIHLARLSDEAREEGGGVSAVLLRGGGYGGGVERKIKDRSTVAFHAVDLSFFVEKLQKYFNIKQEYEGGVELIDMDEKHYALSCKGDVCYGEV